MNCDFFRSFCLTAAISFSATLAQALDSLPQPVAVVDWSKLDEAGQLKTGEIIRGDQGQPARLKVVNTAIGTHSFPLCVLEAPPITTPSYALRGKIRSDNVVGVGFLEMWNHFPGGQYFTRTMDTTGPLQMVTGTSPERQFLLPFHTFGKVSAPQRLVVNLVLNGPGTVEIGPMELSPIDEFAATSTRGDWWDGRTAGLMGGLGGTILGMLGGLLGTLTGFGRAKKLVLALSVMMAGTGLAFVAVGVYAVSIGQSYTVFYPLLMVGCLMLIGGSVTFCVAPTRFRDIELRRMQALDVS